MKILVLGYGLLGKELVKQTNWDYISRTKQSSFDFKKVNSYEKLISSYDTIINCIANTDTYSQNKEEHWAVNYKSVSDLVDICNQNNQKLIHISTDYIYAGSNKNASEQDIPIHNKTWYGYTKLLGDAHVQLKSKDYLIIRCGHKSYPFIYEKAFDDIIGNFDYVDKIATLIIELINNDIKGVRNVGTKLKSMYDLALKSNFNVLKTKSNNNLMPKNISMDISKMDNKI